MRHAGGHSEARAKLEGTNFSKANLYEANLEGAAFKDTVMPDGTIRP